MTLCMTKEEAINRLGLIIYNNYKENLDDISIEVLSEKIKQIKNDHLSKSALNSLSDLLDKIEGRLISGNIQNKYFKELLNKLIETTTASTRDNLIKQVFNLNEKLSIEYFDLVCSKYGSFRLSETIELPFSIFALNYDDKVMYFNDGLFSEDLKIKCIENFNFQNRKISALYGRQDLGKETIEVFMVNNDLLSDTDEELIELIIFHEVCHFLEKTGKFKNIILDFKSDEVVVGERIETIANKIDKMTGGWGLDIHHNKTFGSILFHFLKHFDFDRRFLLTSKAMIKNFLEDVSEKLSI